MRNPSATSPHSIMPAYTWIYDAKLDDSHIEGKIITLRKLGVPYPAGYERQAPADLRAQAAKIAAGLKSSGFATQDDREIVALIAYLQRLGTDIKSAQTAEAR
jgi:cytochrome c oxidase cbb3-type subunit I/II